MTERLTILHADLDSFYASVEQRDNPALRGRPVIVGGGVVLAASYEAKAMGVRTAMNGSRARKLCPEALVVPARMSAYAEASKQVFAIFEQTSPLVEALSIDEAFMDVGGMEHISGSPLEIGRRLRRDVLEQAGLPISVGIARTKFLAKLASAAAKPDGLLVVEPENEIAFLHPLAIERLWGVGKVTSKKLRTHGIETVGDIARLGEDRAVAILGPSAGRHMHALANNRDPRRVQRRGRRRSIGAQRAIPRKPYAQTDLETMLTALVDRIARRLRGSGRSARTVVVGLRFGDFTRATRSHTLKSATSQSALMLETARDLLNDAMPLIDEKGITLISVSLDNLTEGGEQLELDLVDDGRDEDKIDQAVDAVLDRFGSGAITRGLLVGRDGGVAAPVLPD